MTHDLVMNDVSLTGVDQKTKAETAHGPMDEDSFRAFYDRTSRAVWVYLARVTGDRQLADDLLAGSVLSVLPRQRHARR